ncbi:MAG: C40 family peptidase [Bacteroidales bacterium]|nr:C40 family peptidase [Bacteroidales bacterium]
MEKFGIVSIPLINLREQPDHKSELKTQLILGDIFEIKEEYTEWLFIKNFFDNYEGWINKKGIKNIDVLMFKKHQNTEVFYNDLFTIAKDENGNNFPILCGTWLHSYNETENSFIICNKKIYLKQKPNRLSIIKSNIVNLAVKFLNAPYLWGGVSIAGIDCSGLTYIVYRVFGIKLPRDSFKQAEIGTDIYFIENAKKGDLIFFGNENQISHVGLYMGDNKLIHSSGFVRIDYVDNHGIYNTEIKQYTHQLIKIKRIISDK